MNVLHDSFLEYDYFADMQHIENYQLEDEQVTLVDEQDKRYLLFQRVEV